MWFEPNTDALSVFKNIKVSQSIMKLRKIGWRLGLTKERVKKFSDVLYETAFITSKTYYEEPVFLRYGMLGKKHYRISFDGNPASFDLDSEGLFFSFEVGDRVKLGYREEYTDVYDYTQTDFDKKQFIKTTLTKYRFASVQKLE